MKKQFCVKILDKYFKEAGGGGEGPLPLSPTMYAYTHID